MKAPERNPFFSSTSQRTVMLELQTKTKSHWALSYAYLLSILHDPTGSLDLKFSFGSVVIEGQGLSELCAGLMQHSIVRVREADPETEAPEAGKVFVRAISVTIRD